MNRMYAQLFILLLFLNSCAQAPRNAVDSGGLSDRVSAHILYLASDELAGREAGTIHEKMTADYLAAQLRQMGVKPFSFCGDSSLSDTLCYFQPFQATRTTVYRQSTITIMDSSRHGIKGFIYGDDFANFHDMMFPVNITAPVVFAGYGITAPEFHYDDYQFLDVAGKFVMILDGEPVSDDEDYFYGDIPSMYASALFYKRHRAKELGAKGIIVLASGKLRNEWSTFSEFFKSSSLDFNTTPGDSADVSDRMPFVYATPKFFSSVFEYSHYTLDSIEAWAAAGRKVPGFTVPPVLMRLQTYVRRTAVPSCNVIGMIEGSDSSLKKEFVGVGAHYDHLGKNDNGKIYYGADDNASGVSGVLEMARMLINDPPKRSMIIIFHGAEEKGMLGSDYLTMPETNKPFNLHNMVSYLNFDMIGRGHTDSIFIIGSDRISVDLKNMIESVNKQKKYFYFDYAFDRDDDPNHYYYRSDHYNYSRENIPIAFFFDGMTVDYHQMTDTADKINIPKLTKMINLGYRIIKAIGDQSKRFNRTGD